MSIGTSSGAGGKRFFRMARIDAVVGHGPCVMLLPVGGRPAFRAGRVIPPETTELGGQTQVITQRRTAGTTSTDLH